MNIVRCVSILLASVFFSSLLCSNSLASPPQKGARPSVIVGGGGGDGGGGGGTGTPPASSTGITWSSGYQSVPYSSFTDVALSPVVFQNNIYLFLRGVNDSHIYYTIFNGSSWRPYILMPYNALTATAVSTFVFQNKLCLIIAGQSDGALYLSTFDGGTWTPFSEIPNPFNYSPQGRTTFGARMTTSLQVGTLVQNGLLTIYAIPNYTSLSSHILQNVTGDLVNWSGYYEPTNAAYTPNAAHATQFGSNSHLFITGASDRRVYDTLNGNRSYFEIGGSGQTNVDVFPVVFANSSGTRLHVLFKGITDQHVYDNVTSDTTGMSGWSGYTELPGSGSTNVGLSAVSYQNSLYVFMKGINDGHVYYQVGN